MSFAGKIFAFLNLLGVLGVLAMGMMLYGKKTAWANAAAQQDLRLAGVALNAQELDGQGVPRIDNQSEANVKAVVPGPFVKTQVEEVDRVHKLVLAKVTEPANKQDKLRVLADVLLPFATDYRRYSDLVLMQRWMKDAQTQGQLKTQLSRAVTAAAALVKETNDPNVKAADQTRGKRLFEDALPEMANVQGGIEMRPFVQAYIAAQKDAQARDFNTVYDAALDRLVAEADQELDGHYKAAFSGNMPSGIPGESPKPVGSGVQRQFIVRYLYNVARVADPDGMKAADAKDWAPPAIQRVVGVVGLEAFPGPLLDQAARLGTLGNRMRMEIASVKGTVSVEAVLDIDRELEEFAAQHARLIRYLKELDLIYQEREARLARQQAAATAQEAVADASKKLNDELARILKGTRGDVDAEIKAIRELTESLRQIRLQARDAAEYNQKLEAEIRRLERLHQ